MSSKALLTAVIISILLMSTLAGVQFKLTSGNPYAGPYLGNILIESPTNNTVYDLSTLFLNFTTELETYPGSRETTISYSLDGQASVVITNESVDAMETNTGQLPDNPVSSVILTGLHDGMHEIKVHVEHVFMWYDGRYFTITSDSEVHFTVENTAPPIKDSHP